MSELLVNMGQLIRPSLPAALRRLWNRRTNREMPLHLRGLTPAPLPSGQLWQALCHPANLDKAFDWLREQTADASDHSDVWQYRRDWPTRKTGLAQDLQLGKFSFQTVRVIEVRNEQGETERHEIRCAEDRLIIRAMAQVLQPILQPRLSPLCTHLNGNGGLQQAVRDTQDYIASHPDDLVIKSGVKGYYANIDHTLLADQLRHLLPNETLLHNLLGEFMHRSTESGGNYSDVERGLPLGASLSPLLGAVYLAPLDDLAETTGGFYRRYMDDWVWVLPKRRALRSAIKAQYAVLQALGVETQPDKTFIGHVKKGFDFLGFHCCPTGMRVSDEALSRRDIEIARFCGQGASMRRHWRYLVKWFMWAACSFSACAYGANGLPPFYVTISAGSDSAIK